MGVFALGDAINMARAQGVDLVEIVPNATPPVCRIVDYGKFRYEQSKKDKENRKHQHATKVKEIQLSPSIDPHDFATKLNHATEFLCEEMKVKLTLRFRGREMAHKELGFQQVNKFIGDVAQYGHPDAAPKLIGKGIVVMLSPLPRNKRGKAPPAQAAEDQNGPSKAGPEQREKKQPPGGSKPPSTNSSGFANNPFSQLDQQLPES